MKRRGFRFRAACRVLNPELAAKLDPVAPLERDLRDRLTSIEDEIDRRMQRRNAHVGSDRLATLIDERRRLREALGHDKTGSKP